MAIVASADNIYKLASDLIAEGLTVEQARERLSNEVDEACDEIAYGDDDSL